MVARVVWDHEAAGSSPVTSTIGMRRRFIEICGASVIRYTLRAIPHNSKCRYGERGAAAAKPKAQIILDVLSSILATQMPCRTPSRSEALRSATAACGGSWRGDPPERCLSRKAGIMRCCLSKLFTLCLYAFAVKVYSPLPSTFSSPLGSTAVHSVPTGTATVIVISPSAIFHAALITP